MYFIESNKLLIVEKIERKLNKIKKNEKDEEINETEINEDKYFREIKNKDEHKMQIEEYYGVKEEEYQEEIYFGY